MRYEEYLLKTKRLFTEKNIKQSENESLITYDSVFKLAWFATKLKIFSFVNYAPSIDRNIIKEYSKNCLKYALRNKPGLPRGFQNGVVSNNVLVSDNITPDALEFVNTRPKKHFSAFELPMIYDLNTNTLYYYQGGVIFGAVYEHFIREYATEHFKLQ